MHSLSIRNRPVFKLLWSEEPPSISKRAAVHVFFKYRAEIVAGRETGIKSNIYDRARCQLQLLFCIFDLSSGQEFGRGYADLFPEFHFKTRKRISGNTGQRFKA